MRGSNLVALALLMSACLPKPVALPPDEQLTVDAALYGWREAGLPDPGPCLRGATVVWASSPEDYTARCASGMGISVYLARAEGVTVEHSAACLGYRTEQRGLDTLDVPVAILRPGQALFDATGSVATHEWLHALVQCLLQRPLDDPADAYHSDPRVWEAKGGASSAQARARVFLQSGGHR